MHIFVAEPVTYSESFYSITYTVTQYYEWMYRYYYNLTTMTTAEATKGFSNDKSESLQATTPFSILEKSTSVISDGTEQLSSMEKTTMAQTVSSPTRSSDNKMTSKSKSNAPLAKQLKTKAEKKQKSRLTTIKTTEKIAEQTKRIITHGELIASISSAAQAGVLGTLLVCLAVLGFLCSKGVLSLNVSSPATAHPSLMQMQTPFYVHSNSNHTRKKVQKPTSKTKSSHKTTKVQELQQRKPQTTKTNHTTSKQHKQHKQFRGKHTNLKTSRELTWKTRTCFAVDETETPKKENVLLKILNKATNNNTIQDSKRGQSYLKSPSVVDLTVT